MSRNEDEVDRTEKVEKGTKVRRTLSSLRNRMTGSFNKDKVKGRSRRGPPPPHTHPGAQLFNPPSVSVPPHRVRTERQAGREAGRADVERAAVTGTATAWYRGLSPAVPPARSAARPCRKSMACSA